jgi:hypothetical protein
MITVKVYFENGDSLISNINTNFQCAKEYYEGNIFNIGIIEDNLQKCTNIELLEG